VDSLAQDMRTLYTANARGIRRRTAEDIQHAQEVLVGMVAAHNAATLHRCGITVTETSAEAKRLASVASTGD